MCIKFTYNFRSRKGQDRKSDKTSQKNKRGDIENGIKLTALRFHTGGGDIRIAGLPLASETNVMCVYNKQSKAVLLCDSNSLID